MVNQSPNRAEYPAEVSLAGGKGGVRDLVDALLGAMPVICPGLEGEGGRRLSPGQEARAARKPGRGDFLVGLRLRDAELFV